MANVSDIFGRPFTPPDQPRPEPPEAQLRDAIAEAGITPPERIVIDGNLHRFSANGKPRDDSGWYVAFPGPIPGGQFGDWRTGISVPWRADIGRELTAAEHIALTRHAAEAKRIREAEQAKRRESAADTAEAIWQAATPAHDDHPYLSRKRVSAHGLRVTGDGRLVCPMFSPDGELTSLQFIDADGEKRFLSGGKVSGATWMIGTAEGARTIYVCEGVATAITIFEATGQPVVVAYSASNLTAAAQFAANMGPVVVVGDNDESGTGQREAVKAADAIGCRVVIPPNTGQDVNDYAQDGGDVAGLLRQHSTDAVDVADRLKLVFADDLPPDYQPPDEIIEGLITSSSTTVIYGDSNSGKTFFALSLARAIACGDECYGRRTDRGLVVYLASESPGSIRSRVQAMQRFYSDDLSGIAIVQAPVNFYESSGDAVDVISVIRHVESMRGQPVRLVIADTLARIASGANENSGEDMGPVMARFDAVVNETGVSMVIIHHAGKDAAKGARGWSGIRAHVDTEIEVVAKDGVRVATITKQRELPSKDEEIFFKLETIVMGVGKFGNQVSTCVAVHDEDGRAKNIAAEDDLIGRESRSEGMARKFIEGAILENWGVNPTNGMPFISRNAVNEYAKTAVSVASESGRRAVVSRYLKTAVQAGIVVVNDCQDYEIADQTIATALRLVRR